MTPLPPLEVRPRELLALHAAQDWERLSLRLLALLQYFADHTWAGLPPEEQLEVDVFVSTFLFLFTLPAYVVPPSHRLAFVQFNPVLSNVVAMSSVKTTDAWLPLVAGQTDNLAKIFTLYSARNRVQIDRQRLFAANPNAASLWYSLFLATYVSALVDETAWQNLREHIRVVPDEWGGIPGDADAYFSSTYIHPESDPQFRAHINKSLQATVATTPELSVRNRANPRRIAVASAFWYPQHSACRIQYEFVRSLAEDYELVLVQLGSERPDVDTGGFREVIRIQWDGTLRPLQALTDNAFRMVYFPDIGMNVESIVLANMRLAPLQVTTYGHPVSTFGGEVDYFIGSETIEDPTLLADIYTERPVLLPGLCVVHNRPPFEAALGVRPRSDRFIVNCSWFSQKVNADLLGALQRIAARSRYPLLFRFFPGGSASRLNHFVPFVRGLQSHLGAGTVDLVPDADYTTYMTLLQEGTMALDSFHFGGSNVVVDSLHVRRPIVCREGSRWFNRIGPAMLRQLGLADLVAASGPEYEDKAVHLINDTGYRAEVQARLDSLDLDERLYHRREVPHFRAAVDYLMTHHERLKAEGSRKPILVREILARAGAVTAS